MEITSIHEARKNLPNLIKRALAGEEIILSEGGNPIVRLTPLEQKRVKKRQPGGSWKGKVIISDDFDDEDEEIIKMFEG